MIRFINGTKTSLVLAAGAFAIAGMAALGFGAATANAAPPDPCAAACHGHHQPF